MIRIEALALAIANQNDALNPGSEAFSTLNPGMLRNYSIERLHPANENGTRIFRTFHAGWCSLTANLEAKCKGQTRAKGDFHNGHAVLNSDSTIRDLVKTFRFVQPRKVVEFLQDALDDKAISETTPLRFFIEGQQT